MKKILTCLSIIAAVFLLGSTKVYAKTLQNPHGLSNLCVKKEGTSITIKFEVNQDTNANDIYPGVSDGNEEKEKYDSLNIEDFKIVDNATTCDSTNVTGTTITETTKIATGSTLYYQGELEDIDFQIFSLGLYYTLNDDDYIEEIDYNIKNSKYNSITHNNISYYERMTDMIIEKYNGYLVVTAGDGDFCNTHFSFVPDKKPNEDFTNVAPIGWVYFTDYSRSEEEVLKEVAALIAKANVTIPFETTNTKITNDYFEGIKALNKVVTYEQKVNDKVSYAWSFDGSKIGDTNLSVDLTLNVGKSANQASIEALVPTNKKSLVLEFAHHGILPEGTSVKVNVVEQFKDGKKLALYYYNEGKLERVAKNLEVKNGFVEFALEHCSDYVLVEETNNAQTGTLNVALYSGLAVISLLGIGYLIVSKKKNM